MITVDEDIKTASQLKRVIRDAVMEYAKHNNVTCVSLQAEPIVYSNSTGFSELTDVNVDINVSFKL